MSTAKEMRVRAHGRAMTAVVICTVLVVACMPVSGAQAFTFGAGQGEEEFAKKLGEESKAKEEAEARERSEQAKATAEREAAQARDLEERRQRERAEARERSVEASVRAYLRLRRASVRAETSKLAAAGRSERSWAVGVQRQCGGALAAAPSGRRRVIFKAEIAGAVLAELMKPYRQMQRRYARDIGRLRWGVPQVARLVGVEARAERALAGFDAPNVCSDARRWAGSGFTELPHGTRAFVGRLEHLFSGAEPQAAIQQRIAEYETPAQKAIVRALDRTEKKDARRIVGMWAAGSRSVAHALGLTG